MSDEIKRISIKEFRELGFIQEINRRLLHPCGLALEVIGDVETGEWKLGGVWDYRGDPEGMAFADDVLDRDKSIKVNELFFSRIDTRERELGYHIQPIPEE